MTTNPQPDRLDDLRAEYANTGMVTSDGAVWLISQVVVLREQVQQLAATPVPPSAPASRAAILREAADELGRMDYETDSNDYGYDTYRDAWNGGVMDGAGLLRRMADEEQQAEAQTDRNSGVGWYEVINPRNATTCIAYAHEDGSLYLPEGDDLTPDEFAFAAARGQAHRLVRADDPAAVSQPGKEG